MLGGALVFASLVCAASAVSRFWAAVLFAGALACAAADDFGAGEALHAIACVLATAGTATMVVTRLGRPLPLTWLDSSMGGCAVGALAVTTGAGLPSTIAAVGVAATLAL